METQPAGATPQAAQAAVPSDLVGATPASSLPSASDPTISKIRSAQTPASIRALARELMSAPPQAPAQPAPTGSDPAPAVAEAPATEVAPATPTPEVPGETPVPAEPAPEAAAPEPGTVDTPEARNLRLRLPESDKVGRTAAAYQQRNPDWTLEECLTAAKKQLGINPSEAPKPEAPKDPSGNQFPTTVEAVDAQIEALEKERRAARSAMDLEKGEDLDVQIRRLDRHRVALERQAEQRVAQEESRYNQQFDDSAAQAGELYEFARNPESPGAKRMKEIEQDLKDTGSPLYTSADKPLKIAHMVAAELNIAPRRKGAPPAPVKPAAPPAPKKQMLPGGSTVPVAGNQQELATIAKIKSAKTPYEVRKLADQLVGRR